MQQTRQGAFSICDKFPKHFGDAGTKKRKSTQNLVVKWQGRARKGAFHKIRKQLNVPKPEGTSDIVELADQESVGINQLKAMRSAPVAIFETSPPTTITTTSSVMSSLTSPSKFRLRKTDGTFSFFLCIRCQSSCHLTLCLGSSWLQSTGKS